MEFIIDFIKFMGQSVYTTLPAIFANMAPIFVKKINLLNYPIDFNKTINGEPILGPKKTIRGFVSGVLLAMIIFYLQYGFYKLTNITYLGLVDYETVNITFLGFLMGFGVMMGDTVESFIKRRLRFPSSKKFIPWDQLDCVLGGLVFVRIGWAYSLKYAITIIVLTFFIHTSLRHLGYYLGFTESKW